MAKNRPVSPGDRPLPLPGRRRNAPLLSPLRYPGGKRRLVRYIERFFTINELRPELFVEPFAGGASVSLHVLERGLAQRVLLADLDPLVAGFWKTVLDANGSEWLVEQVMTIPVTLKRWKSMKAAEPTTDRERALTCLFLNRTSFSGILNVGAGPLGGMRQESAYGIDCRFPRETLARRIREIATYGDRVTVWQKPWRETLGRVAGMQTRGSITGQVCYYFDPPFFEKAESLYRHYFAERDHVALRNAVLALRDDWFLSYDVADGLHRLWDAVPRRKAHIELMYQMPQRVATEAILSNLDLPGTHDGSPPAVETPQAVHAAPARPAPLIAWKPVRTIPTAPTG